MDSLTSVLQSPAVQQLLPAVLGAAGGTLSSPRLQGGRGMAGNALLGATQGLTEGTAASQGQQQIGLERERMKQQGEYQAMLTKHYQLADKITQHDVDAQAALDSAFNGLPPEEKRQFVSPAVWAEAKKQEIINNMDAPSLMQVAISQGGDPRTLPKTTTGLQVWLANHKPISQYESATLGIERERTAGEQAYQQVQERTAAGELALRREEEPLVPVGDPSSASGYTYRERGKAVGQPAPPPAATLGVTTIADPTSATGARIVSRGEAVGKEAPAKESATAETAKGAGAVAKLEKTYEAEHPRPVAGGLRSDAMAKWRHGFNESLVAKGIDPTSGTPLTQVIGETSQPDGKIVHNGKGEVGGVYQGKVYRLSLGTE